MHDPKFEQEVQRRMDDLEFIPSESVWAGIRQGISPGRRRRAVAIFWWLLPGALLVAGGILMYRHSASTGGVAVAIPVVKTVKAAGGAGEGIVGGEKKTGGAGEPVSGGGGISAGQGMSAGRRMSAEQGVVVSGKRTGGLRSGVVENETSGEVRVIGSEEGAAEAGRLSGERYQPGLIGGWALRWGIKAPPLEWQPVKTAVTGISRPRHPWAVGLEAGGGAASVFSGAGTALTTVSSGNSNASYAAFSSNNSQQLPGSLSYPATASAGVKQNKTEVQPGYSYWAGVYGEKQLSARWSVDIGLNLHYYTVRFATNEAGPNYAPTSASLFNATSVTYALSSANAVSAGGVQTYYNNYYFLEVPAMVQLRLNRSRSLPVFWRGGAVFSYLVSSNGVYYDNSTGNDEKDNGVVRRMQASIQSGLMVGLPVRGVQIQAGPEVQYAPSSLLTVGSGGGHLVYGGMRVALMR